MFMRLVMRRNGTIRLARYLTCTQKKVNTVSIHGKNEEMSGVIIERSGGFEAEELGPASNPNHVG